MRVDRLIHGNPGVFRNLTEGVAELKIDVGPGYKVYYSIRGDQLLLLLTGGSKSTQSKDIAKALELNRNFRTTFNDPSTTSFQFSSRQNYSL